MAVQIPFSDHTQSPRICYQSSMAKQAIGFIPNSSHKTETVSYTLDYIQKTLCSTKMATLSGIDANPNGINALVAIACYTGYNQEDSLIINQSSLDRGLFSISVSRTYMVEEKKNGIGNEECICNPPDDKRKLHYNYEHLDQNGIVFLKTFVKKNDVIIGKVVTKTTKKETTIVDDSVHATEDGQVVKIVIKPKKSGNIVKVVISKRKIPEIGDKFCSFTAQKGTCGMIYNQEDMPFTEQGICPDIIINPHCIPSRMTINQIIACVLGKIKCVTNKKFTSDGTPFEKTTNFKKLCDRLQEEGFSRNGTEILYNGFTGELIKAQIFFGPTYYHRLKHLVADKIHARAQGQVTALTRQPNCGRSKNGGLRVGEMEKDSMLVHGISRFIKERMFETSDYNTSFVCTNCGIICSEDICHSCKSDSSNTNMPYAAKLLFQELNAMGIRTKIDVA
jgi:DNA-directed RNA polymerase II subunit RPB2